MSSYLPNSDGFLSRIKSTFLATALAVLLFAAFTASAFGEGARVFRTARLTYLEGTVRVEQASNAVNSVAVLNMPLIEGSVLSTGTDGRAEIEFEDGSLARITPNSGLSLVNLSLDSSGTYQTRIALLGGLSYLELRASAKFVYTVDAGGDILSPLENATIRVNLDEPPAVISVLDGSVHIAAADGTSIDANAGQTVQSETAAATGIYTIRPGIAPESWDRWNEDRDEGAANDETAQTDVRDKFAGNQGYGWSDLDAKGNWYDVPGHGQVWQPDVAAAPEEGESAGDPNAAAQETQPAAGFDPYGYGSWAWTPAGYSWASGYEWGWLPYRCGQWAFYDGFGWGWSPNLYCGVYAFGGYGYGGYGSGFNFGHLPGGYKRPHRPIPGPGPIHPILRGQGGSAPVYSAHRIGKERVIAGTIAQPRQPVGSEFMAAGGGALGAGLRRDYPIDNKTHAPVLGVGATTYATSLTGTAAATSNARRMQTNDPATGQLRGTISERPIYAQPAPLSQLGRGGYQPGSLPNQGVSRPAPVSRPTQSAPMQRQSAPSTPRYSPPQAPASHSAPAPSSSKGK